MDLASSADENHRHIVMMINSQIKFISRALGLILSSLERLQRTGRPVCVPHTLAHARTNATCKKLLRQSRARSESLVRGTNCRHRSFRPRPVTPIDPLRRLFARHSSRHGMRICLRDAGKPYECSMLPYP